MQWYRLNGHQLIVGTGILRCDDYWGKQNKVRKQSSPDKSLENVTIPFSWGRITFPTILRLQQIDIYKNDRKEAIF